LLVISASGAVYYLDKSRDLALEKNKVEMRVDSLMKEQRRLETEKSQQADQLQTMEKENQTLTRQVADTEGMLQRQTSRWSRLQNTHARQTIQLDTLQSQINDLASQRERITEENRLLIDQNAYQLQQLGSLQAQLQSMVPRTSVTADGFRVEAIKRNDKVTAKAKKVHNLNISFSVPAVLELTGTEKELYLSLTEVNNAVTLTPLMTLGAQESVTNAMIPVHAMKTVNFTDPAQRISFTLEAPPEMKSGTYKASVYTKDAYLGSVEWELRDSFWFF
jgi:cell division protein FtsL